MWDLIGTWLHMIGVRKSPGCELCRGERRKGKASDEALPVETVAHLQSAGCKAQKKSVIGGTRIQLHLHIQSDGTALRGSQYSVFSNCSSTVTVSSSGPPGLFKGVTTAMSGVLARFPWLLPVRNSVNRGVVTRARIGDLKQNWFIFKFLMLKV